MRSLVLVLLSVLLTPSLALAQSLFTVVQADRAGSARLVPLPQAEFAAQLAAADVIVLGERHGQAAHQNAHLAAIRLLVLAQRRPSLVLEMLKPQQMVALAEHRGGSPLNAATLGEALTWWQSGWPAWAFYQPIFQAAYDANLALYAGDLDDWEAEAVQAAATSAASAAVQAGAGNGGPLLDPLFALPTESRVRITASWQRAMGEAHCNVIDDARRAELAALQIARDQALARASLGALAQHPGQPVVVIVGASHARNDRGVPLYLRTALPQLTVVSIGLVDTPDALDPLDASDSAAIFDIAWQVGAGEGGTGEDGDPCAAISALFGAGGFPG